MQLNFNQCGLPQDEEEVLPLDELVEDYERAARHSTARRAKNLS